MENRIEKLRGFIENQLFNTSEGVKLRFNYICHMNAVSQFCALIALKRGENTELATMAGLLHDYYVYKTLDHKKHAKRGAELAREVLGELSITTADETDKICSAIRNHSTKDGIHSPFDEILVDADVLQHTLFNVTLPVLEGEESRFEALAEEFGFNCKEGLPPIR